MKVYFFSTYNLGKRYVAYNIEEGETTDVVVDLMQNAEMSEEVIAYIVEKIEEHNIRNAKVYLWSYILTKGSNLKNIWLNTEPGKKLATLIKENNLTIKRYKETQPERLLLNDTILEVRKKNHKANKKNNNIDNNTKSFVENNDGHTFFGEVKELEDYNRINMFVRGITAFNDEDRKSYSIAILSKGTATREFYLKGVNSTPERMILSVITDAVSVLKEPCLINIYTHTKLSLSHIKYNKELKEELVRVLTKGNHCIKVTVSNQYQEQLQYKIKTHFNN